MLALAKKQSTEGLPRQEQVYHEKGHGRLESRTVKVYPFKPEFPHIETLIVVDRERTIVKTGKQSKEVAYYLSTAEPDDYPCNAWAGLIRGHWGGVENRNHWRRDALLLEDRTRSHNPTICGSMALLRNACLVAIDNIESNLNLNEIKQACTRAPQIALSILSGQKSSYLGAFK